MRGPNATTLWFIGGSVRSGSTVLAGMISLATGGFNAGELHLLWRSFTIGRLCTCTSELRRCPVWGPVHDVVLDRTGLTSAEQAACVEAMEPSQKSAIALGDRARSPSDVVALRRGTEDAIREVTGLGMIIDSSKVASTAVVAGRLPRDMRVVHLVRDPRAVAFSSSRPKSDPSMHGKLMPRQTPARSALNWLSFNLAFERLATQGSTDVTRVSYEDLVAAPDEVFGMLALGSLPSRQTLSGRHSIAGNPWRFDPDNPIRLDDRWKRELPLRHRRIVDVITLPLRIRYGY